MCINLVVTIYELKSQYIKLTQLWLLTLNCVRVSMPYLAGLHHNIVKNLFLLHICRTKWLYSSDLMFYSNFRFTIFSLMLFPLLTKVFTDILKIYELPKIYNNRSKFCQKLVLTIIIYQANSMSNFIWLLNYTPINFVKNAP